MNSEIFAAINNALIETGQRQLNDEIELKEFLLYRAKEVKTEILDSHRWYDSINQIVIIGTVYIRYAWYHMTGDDNPQDMGLDFNYDSISIVEPYEETVINYRNIQTK